MISKLSIWSSESCACSNYAFAKKFYARLIYLFFVAVRCAGAYVCVVAFAHICVLELLP